VGENRPDRRLVLVVDDHAPLRTLCRLSLEPAGFRVAEAADGREALASIAAERPDVILLDMMMPHVSGWRVAASLLDERGGDDIPIIFITARAGQSDRVRAFELGAHDYLAKPFDPSILPEVIARVLDEIERGERDPKFAETLGALRAERVLEPRG
jgi:CheY-like chemotaxis protein